MRRKNREGRFSLVEMVYDSFKVLLVLIIALSVMNYLNSSGSADNKALQVTAEAVVRDSIAPSVSISSPPDFYNSGAPSIVVVGMASDNIAVKIVRIKVNNGQWETASGTTSWSKTVTLEYGSNTIYAQAFDNSENASPIAARNFIYSP